MGKLLLAGALALAPAMALAQEAPPPANAPAVDSVGPKELQNFSLNGTVTRQSDRPVAVPSAPAKRQPRPQVQTALPAPTTRLTADGTRANSAPASVPAARRTETASVQPPPPKSESAPEPLRQSPPSSSVTIALPKIDSSVGKVAATPAAAPAFAPAPEPVGTLAPEHSLPLLPWLLAAIALGAGGTFLFWRNRGREAFAGGPRIDAFTAPEPAPRPAPPAPAPSPKPAARSSPGIVSTRLRPWIDIAFRPLRCILQDQQLVAEFEVELFNSGSAPARAVLVEAALFNAGPSQDEQIGAFSANPVGEGERIVAIPPLNRITIRSQVVAQRDQMQAYELAGRQVLVPIIAFNALYRWSGGDGQTSVSYLLGRDTKGEKLGPFRLDLGPHIFRGVAARLLPTGVRA